MHILTDITLHEHIYVLKKRKHIRNIARTITATAEETVPNSMEIHIAYTCNVEREF